MIFGKCVYVGVFKFTYIFIYKIFKMMKKGIPIGIEFT